MMKKKENDMTIRDIINISTIIREKSINKASKKLYISQPALSKCVRRAEEEYGITIFRRTKGSVSEITPEGEIFGEMAERILRDISLFEEQLARLRSQDDRHIVFASTLQRVSSVSGYITRWIYEKEPEYLTEIRTYPSRELKTALKAGAVDFILVSARETDPEFWYEQIMETYPVIYLRNGSDARSRSVHDPDRPFPVLSVRDLAGETIVTSLPGTGGRRRMEQILAVSGKRFELAEESNFYLRKAMVDAGRYTAIVSSDILPENLGFDRSRIFCLPEKENIIYRSYLVCRREHRDDRRLAILKQILQEYYHVSA